MTTMHKVWVEVDLGDSAQTNIVLSTTEADHDEAMRRLRCGPTGQDIPGEFAIYDLLAERMVWLERRGCCGLAFSRRQSR